MKILLKTPLVSQKVREKIRAEVEKAFGGRFYENIIGGAAFNQEIEQFLHFIGLPFTVGYGATECAPIISYNDWHDHVPGSCGKAVVNMEVKIDSANPNKIPGEILTKGMNVMLGYFKNEEATKQALDAEGWYHTGDLGVIDSNGNIFIKGRSKNMLLGASGQNIFPEEIEDALNSLPLVTESLVVQRDDKLIGLVYPDFDEAKTQNLSMEQIKKTMEQNRQTLNETQPAYCKLAAIEIQEEEFEKTPKKSIKRYLYK
jgi:long-chain acyl-CoA synthetase